MTTKEMGSIRRAAHEAYNAAIEADNVWQTELDTQKIDRYSVEAKGTDGSNLRQLYERKIEADNQRRELTDLMRKG